MRDTDKARQTRAELLENLGRQAETLRSDTGWLTWLRFASRFRNYSLGNQMLILGQRPDARFVAGFRSWQALGRYVRRGEKGIAILAPLTRPTRDGEEPDVDSDRVLMGFRIVFVFDISQTEGDELPELSMPQAYVPDLDLFGQLLTLCENRGYHIEWASNSASGILGRWTRSTQTIELDVNQDYSSMTCTLLHELAHALDPNSCTPESVPAERELVAESAAYLVGTELGIEMREQSTHYVMAYGATSERLLELAEEVLATAQALASLTAALPLPLG